MSQFPTLSLYLNDIVRDFVVWGSHSLLELGSHVHAKSRSARPRHRSGDQLRPGLTRGPATLHLFTVGCDIDQGDAERPGAGCQDGAGLRVDVGGDGDGVGLGLAEGVGHGHGFGGGGGFIEQGGVGDLNLFLKIRDGLNSFNLIYYWLS